MRRIRHRAMLGVARRCTNRSGSRPTHHRKNKLI